MTKYRTIFILLTFQIILVFYGCTPMDRIPEFDGDRAYAHVEKQVSFGPRYVGSDGHKDVQDWIENQLIENGWQVESQPFDFYGIEGNNIIASRDSESLNEEWIIIGAHYDTRIFADEDPDPAKRDQPVIGANDGASGAGILLELSRVLPELSNAKVWMVFFDAEDNGYIRNYDWIAGSTYFVEQLELYPDKVIVVDMVGDSDQNIYFEITSDRDLASQIWRTAENLGIESFVHEGKYAILDDHTPFLREGISTTNIIDFDYPYWHTTQDTLDKISPISLDNVGDVLLAWLLEIESNSDIISE